MLEFLTPVFLGMAYGIIPGPVIGAALAETMQHGFLKSLRIIFTGMAVEFSIANGVLFTLSSAPVPLAIFHAFSFLGAVVLTYIGIELWRVKEIDATDGVSFTTDRIIAMVVANGVLWLFWVTVAAPQAIAFGHMMSYGQYLYLILIELGWFISTAGAAFIFSWFRDALARPRFIPILFKLFAFAFFYFAFGMAYASLIYFLG